MAKELLAETVKAASPRKLVRQRGLGKISGKETLAPLVEQVIAENPDAVDNFRNGKEKALAFWWAKWP